MNILLLARYGWLGASSRVRFYQYLPWLEAQGFHFDVVPLLPDEYVKSLYSGKRWGLISLASSFLQRMSKLLASRKYDLLWIEKEIFPWLPSWFESVLMARGVSVIVDYDDAIFHQYDNHLSWFVRKLRGRKIDKVMSAASIVVAGNEYLKRRALSSGSRRVELIPTCVDIERYFVKPTPPKAVPVIGWIGTPLTSRYLDPIRPALAQVCRDGRAKVLLIGAKDPGWDDVPYEVVPWSAESEVGILQDLDIGIMPLLDTPWERGKCGYKLIQYMACGRAVVASPIGANREIVADGVNGFLANSVSEWAKALITLIDNPDLRQKFGLEGRKIVEQTYSVQVAAPRLAALFHEAGRTKKKCAA